MSYLLTRLVAYLTLNLILTECHMPFLRESCQTVCQNLRSKSVSPPTQLLAFFFRYCMDCRIVHATTFATKDAF